MQESFQALSAEELLERLQTSSQGLSREEAKRRLAQFGKNLLREEKISHWRIFFRQFNNALIYILFAASLVSLSIREWADFAVINVIILFNGVLGFWQELKAEISIAALKKLTESRNKVMRDGKMRSLPSSELVPGDYLIFHEGEIVTADVRLVEGAGLMIDESSMTGESTPVVKDSSVLLEANLLPYEWKNMLLAGTSVLRGTGSGVVVRTGSQTYLASVAEKAQESSPDTPLTKSLQFFAKRYVILLLLLFALLGGVGFFQGRALLDLAYILLAGLVSAVPEGLPIVVTLVMVIGAMALSKRQALVRYLPSVETLGSASVIASDKTGTITEGRLIVKEVYARQSEELKQVAALCNDAQGGSGDPLDVALSQWVEEYEERRRKYRRKWAYSFDTRLMFMATVNQTEQGDILFIKGAYEALKERASHVEKGIEQAFSSFLEQGLRVLAFGRGRWERNEDPASWKIELVGLIGFLDPPKEGVREAVISAKSAGIRVLMITGDHPLTAKAVAQEVDIWREGEGVLSGKEVEGLSDASLLQALRHTTVLARILPEHKYRIVKLLQNAQERVAVTGDGVNDVPALKAADIGIAMGGGTEAAKSASKMVITDNNLRVIVEAIQNARVIADNIRKVIYYLISTSLQELCLLSFAILSSLPLPLSAIQILWINIVTDGVQDKAFPFAKEEGNVMRRRPRRPEKQFFDGKQIARILFFGISMGFLSCLLYLYLMERYSHEMTSSILFTSVVVAQWANGIQAQKETEPFFCHLGRSFSINPLIFLGLGIGFALQCAALYLMPSLFHSAPLGWEQWRYPLLAFVTAFGLVELRKWGEHLFFKKS